MSTLLAARYSFGNPLWEHLHIDLQEIFMDSGRVIFKTTLCKSSLALGSSYSLTGALVSILSSLHLCGQCPAAVELGEYFLFLEVSLFCLSYGS